MSENRKPPLAPGSTGGVSLAPQHGAGGGMSNKGGSRKSTAVSYQPPLMGRLSSANLLAPATYKSVGGSLGSTPRGASAPTSPRSWSRRSSADDRILDELERLSAEPPKGVDAAAVVTKLQINTLGPRVLSQQTGARVGDLRPRRDGLGGGAVSATPMLSGREGGRESSRELKPTLSSRHRSASPARSLPLSSDDRGSVLRGEGTARSAATHAASSTVTPEMSGLSLAMQFGRAVSDANSDMDSHLPPERNPWVVLEKLRQRPERTEFRYMMAYKKDAFTPINPYHLQVVPQEMVDRSDYFTLSLHGVTHLIGGRPEYQDLEEWKRERFIFDSVVQIPVFARYLWWKPFRIWRMWVKYGKIAATKKWLEKNLFMANPTLLATLHKLRLNCHGLFAVPLCSDAPGGLNTLEAFSALQEEQRTQVLMHHEAFWEETLNITKQACRKVLIELEEDFARQRARAAEPQPVKTHATQALLTLNLKSDLIKIPKTHQIENEKPDFKYTVIAAKRAMHSHLYNFLRLSDYIVFSTLLDLVVQSVEGLCERFDHDKAQVMFIAELRQDQNMMGLHHSPSGIEFSTEVDGIANSFVLTASSGNRLLNHSEMLPLLELHDPDEHIDETLVYAMVTQDEKYQQLIDQLRVSCQREFKRCSEACKDFERFVDMCTENEAFNIQAIEEEARKGRKDFTPYVEMIEGFRAQVNAVKEMADYKDYGVVRIILTTFKGQVAPSPSRCLRELERMLPRLLIARHSVLHDEVSDFNTGLSRVPRTVEDFVAYVMFIDKVEKRQDAIDDEVAVMEEEHHQMETAGIKLNSKDSIAYRIIFPELMAMRTSFDMAVTQRDTARATWSRQLEGQVVAFKTSINEIKLLVDDPFILEGNGEDPWDLVGEMTDLTLDLQVQVEALEEQRDALRKFQVSMQRPVDTFDDLMRVSVDIRLKTAVWDAFAQIQFERQNWQFMALNNMEALKVLESQSLNWYRVVMRAGRELPVNKVVPVLTEEVNTLRGMAACCIDLANVSLKDRHWDRIYALTGLKLAPSEFSEDKPCTVEYIRSCGVVQHAEEIQKISIEATQEQLLEEMMAKIKAMWTDAEFVVMPYKDLNDVYVLGGVDEVQMLMDESMTLIGVITASRYVGGIKAEVDKLDSSLRMLQATMDEWLAVQQSWLYLEPVLTAPDIQRQLPSESKLFMFVDKEFKTIMRRCSENPNCLRFGNVPGQREMFLQLIEVLEKVQKSLEDYLEFKRTAFPRFYFLSNEELLEILAETRLVQAVQPHMIKCFDAIKSLDFGGHHPLSPVTILDHESVDIYGMISPEGEYVTLGKTLKARGEVEAWLGQVEKRMVDSLRQLSRDCITDYVARPRGEWVLAHASQIIIMASQIYWCQGAEEALALNDPVGELEKQLESHLLILKEECALVRHDLNALQRMSCVSLITIDVHNRDILESLIADEVSSKSEFSWQMRLRYYWLQELGPIGDCRIDQVMASFVYSYEYLGASGRLVVTELTDRCYMTLTGAMDLMLGGAPAGPAGTGKTETTKDLGKALGRQCVVFNCGENLDAAFMRKFFKGLAQCGAWACFDEFNRINVEVLSVVAQQVISIQQALRARVSDFEFEGKTIRLVHTFGVFITMNPGYAGRSELPENLKALFRPISMMVPDYGLVAEVMLFAEGFDDAKNLAQKMVKLYKLSSEQLSQAKHYDFGMRAVKSVLVMAGARKRAGAGLSEDTILIAAMCDSNVPKFEFKDKALFFAIVGDLFPGKEVAKPSTGDLGNAIEASLMAGKLQVNVDFVHKGIELFETINIRFGVLSLGPTGGGKSTMIFALRSAITDLHSRGMLQKHSNVRKTRIYCFNPKCISLGELYGNYSAATNEWSDGLASSIVRMANNDTTEDKKWILFDGPIDAVWVENMNTVLDDNQTLCLPNGERIKLSSNLRMLFETEEVSQASPATVSRLGVVFLPAAILGYTSLVETWLETNFPKDFSQGICKQVSRFISQGLSSSIEFVRRECKEDLQSVNCNLVKSCCVMFGSVLSLIFKVDEAKDKPNEKILKMSDDDCVSNLKAAFSFALVWSVGANIDAASKEKFSDWYRDNMADLQRYPGLGTVYDYYVDPATAFPLPFTGMCEPFKYNPETPFSELLVPTADTTTYSYLMTLLARQDRNVLLVGLSGTGKSVMVASALADSFPAQHINSFVINFSAQTSAGRVQELLESNLERKRKGVLGAPPGKRLACFVDDVNMPAREVYGAQPPIEMLRQVIDKVHHYREGQGKNPPYAGGCGFYDRKKHFWSDIVDLVLMAACGPPGGGRNPVCPRFFRHFSMLNVSPASAQVLKVIFTSILHGHLRESGFNPDTMRLCKPTVDASVELYGRISTELLPTPTKSHYTFNIRDLSKVFQGLLSLQAINCFDSNTFVRLWIHESQRVFQDRLIDETDKRYFEELLHELLKRKFQLLWDFQEVFVEDKPIFGDFFTFGTVGDDKQYKSCPDKSALPKLMEAYLAEFNVSSQKVMHLIFFSDAIDHISRLCRILRAPRGNAMLVGMGGSGRQSLSRLAAFISECQCCELEITRGYGMVEFREDLKKLFQSAGVHRKALVFLITDSQIVNEGFLEDINCILNSGEVPNLFNADDKAQIASELKDMCLALGRTATKENAYQLFVQNVQAKLHVVLCMSQIGESFRTRCRQFPSLINCCTIDWILPWPEDALLGVGRGLLMGMVQDANGVQVPRIENVDDSVKEALASFCVTVHSSVLDMSELFWGELRRRFYISPKSFLDMINAFIEKLREKRGAVTDRRDKFINGLKKMADVAIVIEQSKLDLNKLSPVLEEKGLALASLLLEVQTDKDSAQLARERVSDEANLVEEQAVKVRAIQVDAQKDLDEALPALESAMRALNSLTKSDITEVRSFAKPPALVQTVMEAVCVLLQQPASWDSAKKILGQSDFMDQLLNYDKDHIADRTIKSLRKFIENPDFQPEVVGKVSKAAKGLCMWCRAMNTYTAVVKEVEPKKARLKEADDKLASAQAALDAKSAELALTDERVANLEAKLELAKKDEAELKAQAKLCEDRLNRASRLTAALGDEQVAWEQLSRDLGEQLGHVAGDMMVASACISYYGPLSSQYRVRLVQSWLKRCEELGIHVSETFSVRSTLAADVTVRDWNIHGLPSNQLSVDNGVVVMNCQRWPLIIDPQLQGSKWIKSMHERKGKLKVTRLSEPNWLRTLEMAVQHGLALVIEDVGESLDPALSPVLLKQVYHSGGRNLIKIGGIEILYDPNFRLYMMSKLPNPHYLPEVCIQTTLVNFIVTHDGLEDQLLGDVVRKERPDLEAQKDKIVVSMAADKKQLQDLQDRVLQLLFESEGMILDNEPLVNTLQQSKQTSMIIERRFKEAESTEESISKAREEYRIVAKRASLLYFVVADLASLNPMYQNSLEYFKRLYAYCIDVSERSSDLAERLDILLSFVTSFMYKSVCRGLFEEHKSIFSFLICSAICRENGEISAAEWNFLLRGGTTPAGSDKLANPSASSDHKLISDDSWKLLAVLESFSPDFEGIRKAISAAIAAKQPEWAEWMECGDPFAHDPPAPWDKKITLFNRVILIRAMRMEKILFAVSGWVALKMGRSFTENPPIILKDIFLDTSAATPIIFLLVAGSDPTAMIFKFAEDSKFLERLYTISLGQGQGPIAEKLIAQASRRGDWVCLMNCHVNTSWLPTLELIVSDIVHASATGSSKSPDDSFRLWLTSMPSSAFPVSILQVGIKLTCEPPKGLKANLVGTFSDLGSEVYDQSTDPVTWKKLLLALAFFHAVVQERRKYGPIGWNIRYEFNTSDFACARDVLRMFVEKSVEESSEIPWEALLYVTGQINYGGRVTDAMDRRCLIATLEKYYVSDLLTTPNYKLSSGTAYYIPTPGTFEDLMIYLGELPVNDDPEVFSMHENANLVFELRETERILASTLNIQPRERPKEGELTPEAMVDNMCAMLLDTLPFKILPRPPSKKAERIVAEERVKSSDGNSMPNSLDTVLEQEMDRFNCLGKQMFHSLNELRKALKGLVVMSEELDAMFVSLRNNQVPGVWAKVSFLSLKPLSSWKVDYVQRIKFFQRWSEQGIPNCFWISGFFFPQGFLTGALQNHARKYKCAVDTLSFGFTVRVMEGREDVSQGPDDGVYVDGVFLEGARWDRKKKQLRPGIPGQLLSSVPVIHLKPLEHYTLPLEDYHCPLYKTNERAGVLSTTGQSTNFVLTVGLPTDVKPKMWVLQGTAMVTMENT